MTPARMLQALDKHPQLKGRLTFQGEVVQRLFQVAAFTAQCLHLVTGRRAGGVTGKTRLARFEEFLCERDEHPTFCLLTKAAR